MKQGAFRTGGLSGSFGSYCGSAFAGKVPASSRRSGRFGMQRYGLELERFMSPPERQSQRPNPHCVASAECSGPCQRTPGSSLSRPCAFHS